MHVSAFNHSQKTAIKNTTKSLFKANTGALMRKNQTAQQFIPSRMLAIAATGLSLLAATPVFAQDVRTINSNHWRCNGAQGGVVRYPAWCALRISLGLQTFYARPSRVFFGGRVRGSPGETLGVDTCRQCYIRYHAYPFQNMPCSRHVCNDMRKDITL